MSRDQGRTVVSSGFTGGIYKPRRWLGRRRAWWYHIVGRRRYTMTFLPRCGVGVTACSTWDVEQAWFTTYWERVGWLVKRPKLTSTSSGHAPLPGPGSHFGSRWTPLCVFAAAGQYDDGSVRQPGYWTMRASPLGWVVTMVDPSAEARLQVIGATVDEALDLACLMLEADDAPWMPDLWGKQRTRRKK